MRIESLLKFQTVDDRIEITFICPPSALMLCASGPHIVARRIPGGLLAERPFGERTVTLVYARVREPGFIPLSG